MKFFEKVSLDEYSKHPLVLEKKKKEDSKLIHFLWAQSVLLLPPAVAWVRVIFGRTAYLAGKVVEGSVEEEGDRDARQTGEPADACGQTQRAPLTVEVWLPETESTDPPRECRRTTASLWTWWWTLLERAFSQGPWLSGGASLWI